LAIILPPEHPSSASEWAFRVPILDERSLAAQRRSLELYGQQKPVVVGPGGVLVAGSGLLRAARSLGWKRLAAVPFGSADRELLEGYKIADNRSAEFSTWDLGVLDRDVKAIRGEGLALEDLGFTEADLAYLEKLRQEEGGAGDLAEGSGEPAGGSQDSKEVECPTCGHTFKVEA
jgi:ParB-like chromosome segregation protein Spo0J